MIYYSIIIPTYQGAASIIRLVESICSSAKLLGIQEELEIVIVIDGSTDGTFRLVSALEYSVHLEIIEQQNAGLAQTRNRGVDAASGNLLWHLDDDMEINPACMAQHFLRSRQQNEIRMGSLDTQGEPSILLDIVRRYYKERQSKLQAGTGSVEAFDFTCSNTSGPARIFREFPFDTRFKKYGMEDHEVATRMCANGIQIVYEPLALVLHHYDHTFIEFCNSMYGEGFNRVQLYQLHPNLFERLFSNSNSRIDSLLLKRAINGDRRLLASIYMGLRYATSSWILSSQVIPKIVRRKLFDYTVASARHAGIAKGFELRPIENIYPNR